MTVTVADLVALHQWNPIYHLGQINQIQMHQQNKPEISAAPLVSGVGYDYPNVHFEFRNHGTRPRDKTVSRVDCAYGSREKAIAVYTK